MRISLWAARIASASALRGGAEIFTQRDLSTGVFLSPGAGSWSSVSDRNTKENFQGVDLARCPGAAVTLPIADVELQGTGCAIRHIGPMAQDFHAAFGVGEDDKHIATIDADGVLFAAVQGLHQMLTERLAMRRSLSSAGDR